MSHDNTPASTAAYKTERISFVATTQADPWRLSDRRLDQFYTRPAVVDPCYKSFCARYDPSLFQLVDPSAGEGAFSSIMPANRVAVDLDPKGQNIIRGDYLKSDVLTTLPIAVLGNPPFGKNSSAAIDFFLHAARTAKVIALILPRTACKASFVRKLPLDMHLMHEELIPDGAYVADSQVRSVPTIFQIWERFARLRVMPPPRITHPHFEFTDREKATFEIQRIGQYAGRIRHNSGAEPPSLHFIKALHPDVEAVMARIDFSDCIRNNAGNPCVSREEIVTLYDDVLVGFLGRYSRPLAPIALGALHPCLCCNEGWPFA